jgi:5'-methylthioadenosine phosphorylase
MLGRRLIRNTFAPRGIPLTFSRSISLPYRKMAGVPSTYDSPVHIAVIGGTGIQSLPGFTLAATLDVDTPWGKPSSPISILQHPSPTTGKPIPVAFLSRHGLHHELAPHEVKNRANIAALRPMRLHIRLCN